MLSNMGVQNVRMMMNFEKRKNSSIRVLSFELFCNRLKRLFKTDTVLVLSLNRIHQFYFVHPYPFPAIQRTGRPNQASNMSRSTGPSILQLSQKLNSELLPPLWMMLNTFGNRLLNVLSQKV